MEKSESLHIYKAKYEIVRKRFHTILIPIGSFSYSSTFLLAVVLRECAHLFTPFLSRFRVDLSRFGHVVRDPFLGFPSGIER